MKHEAASVSESGISVYNSHNSKTRPVSEDNENGELFIAYNGP